MNKSYTQTEYGIICGVLDEKSLVKKINEFLGSQYGYRKMYKAISKSRLEARLPFEYSYYYYQFIKEKPKWYIELYPNTDLNGIIKFDQEPQISWLLYVNRPYFEENSQEEKQELKFFLKSLMDSTGYETVILRQYMDDEERL